MGKEIFLFETRKDLIELLKFIDDSFNVKYTEAGLLDDLPMTNNSLTNKSDIGVIHHKDWVFNERFLILNQDKELQIREVKQVKGGIKYAIDQLKNEDSLMISLGGYNEMENSIIASGISTNQNTDFTKYFFKKLRGFLKKNKKVGRFYIGQEALDKANKGVRLTEDSRQSKDYDISITL